MGDLEKKVDSREIQKEFRFPRLILIQEYESMVLGAAKQVDVKTSYELIYSKAAGDKLHVSPQQPPYIPFVQGVQIRGHFRKPLVHTYVAFIGLKPIHHSHECPTQLTGLEFCGIQLEARRNYKPNQKLATAIESAICKYFKKSGK